MKQNNPAQKWLTLVSVCLGFFMALLDVTVVNVALPTMQKSFNASFSNLQWIVDAYTLIFAAVLLLVSKLGDVLGKKLIFNISMIVFTLFSLGCSLAPNILTLIIFRGFQAIGGAGMMSLSMSIIADTFTGKQRGLALGIWGSVAGLSTALGPLVGGILLTFFSWESVFMVNIPIGIIAVILAIIFIPENKAVSKNNHVDWLGMLLSVAFMFCLVLGFIQKENHYDYSWFNFHIASLLGLGIILLVIFIMWENHSKTPMLDLKLFKNRTVLGAALSNLALGAALYASYTYLIVLMQNYMGYSALQTGLQLLTISVFSLILGPIVGVLSNKIHAKYLIGGALLLGGIGMILLSKDLGYSSTWEIMIPSFIMIGITNALVNPVASNIAVSAVDEDHVGMTSGLLNVGKQFGNSFGLVILGLSMDSTYNRNLLDGFAHLNIPEKIKDIFQSAGPFSGNAVLNQMHINSGVVKDTIMHAFYQSMHSVNLTSGIMFVVIAIICYLLLNQRNGKKKSSN